MSMKHWWNDIENGEQKYCVGNLSPVHSVCTIRNVTRTDAVWGRQLSAWSVANGSCKMIVLSAIGEKIFSSAGSGLSCRHKTNNITPRVLFVRSRIHRSKSSSVRVRYFARQAMCPSSNVPVKQCARQAVCPSSSVPVKYCARQAVWPSCSVPVFVFVRS